MKKTISFILSIVMVLSVLSICAVIPAFAADTDIVIDGVKDDIYKDITPIVVKDADSSAEKANVYVAWDNENMYIFVDVKDTNVVKEDGTENNLNWAANNDYVEIRVDLLRDKNKGGYNGGWGGNYRGDLMCEALLRIKPGSNSDGSARFGTGFSYGGEWGEWWGSAICNWDNSTGKGVSTTNDTGYTVEYKLPTTIAADIPNVIRPHVGQVIGFGVKVNDETDGNAYWESSHDDMWSPSTLSDITLNESNYVGEKDTARTLEDSITKAGTYYTCLRNPAGNSGNGSYYDNGWHWNASSIGIKTTIPDGLSLKKVNVDQVNTGDVAKSEYTLKVYTWKGSVEASVKESALYTSDTYTLNGSDGTVEFTTADKLLNGDLYIEVSANEGTFGFVKASVTDNNAYTFFVNGAEVDGVLGTKGYFEVGVDPYKTNEITTAGTYGAGNFFEDKCQDAHGWVGTKSMTSVGIKFSLADGLKVTELKTGDILSVVDKNVVISVYKWKGDVEKTVAVDAICSTKPHVDNQDIETYVIPSDIILSGDLYVEIKVEDGSVLNYWVSEDANTADNFGLGKFFIDGAIIKDNRTAKLTITTAEYTPEITNAQISLGTDISFNVYANGGANVEFTMNDNVTTVPVVDGKATLTGITPQCINDLIDVELLDSEGKTLDTREDVTIAQLLADTKEASDDSEVDALVDALLNYGAAAQDYRNYKADTTTVDTTKLMAPEKTTVKANNGVEGLVAAGVRFDYNNKVYFVLNSKVDNATINGKAVTGEAYGDNYIYYSEGINATEFANTVTLTVGDKTATYSVNSFAYSMADDEDAGNLAKALYTYGVAAADYKN